MIFHTIAPHCPLILASSSPRRKRLLRQLGLPFRIRASRVDENGATGEPATRACALAEKKARTAFRKAGNRWILGADTLVVFEDRMLGKPLDEKEAAAMLSLLSGKEHRVVTGFCLLAPEGHPAHSEAVTTRVRMKRLGREEILGYIATGEPFGKAGGYAIQGIGAFMVEGISGSYTNVVGLPVCAVIKALLAAGALKNFPLAVSPRPSSDGRSR
ncbi:MAG: septum formation protein Maf [Deltaproteobacteria bacterium]|nr:septum formation protein Maf [Deltaproteobacteria bacterium]